MSFFTFLCLVNATLQLTFVVLFFIFRKWIDLISFGVCLSTILVPVVFESFGMEDYFSSYLVMFFLLLIVILSGYQLKSYYELKETFILVRAINLVVIAILYVFVYFYAELLNLA